MAFAEDTTEPTLVENMVRALMARHGIAKRSQTKALSEILVLSFSQAHRKLSGTSEWTLGQIQQVAEHFGESLDSLGVAFSPTSIEGTDLDAFFCVGQHEFPCLIQIGATLHTAKNVNYVAFKAGNIWRVCPSENAPNDVTIHRVTRLEMRMQQAKLCSVAVIDDDRGTANGMCKYINEVHSAIMVAEPFYEITALQEKLKHKRYDAFVIDWLIGTQTAEPLIRQIRAIEGSPTPIILLTGGISSGRTQEAEFARMIKEYDLAWQIKPENSPLIAAELFKVLGIA